MQLNSTSPAQPTACRPVIPPWWCRPGSHTADIGLVVVIVGVFHLALFGEFARKHHWDLSASVQASVGRVRFPEFAAISAPLPAGHDGQFYYLLAQRPFAAARRDLLDVPARHARLLYPFLGWLFSAGGNPRALIYALP